MCKVKLNINLHQSLIMAVNWSIARNVIQQACVIRIIIFKTKVLDFRLQMCYTPCRFGVRIVLLKPPACRKRRLKGDVRGSLVATSAAARCQGPRFYPRQDRNFDQVFCSMRTAVPSLGPRDRVPEPVPSLETHLKSE